MKRNYTEFYAILPKLEGKPSKEDLVKGFTSGRTDSLRELTDREYNDIIRVLYQILGKQKKTDANYETRQLRSDIIKLCEKLGIVVVNSDWSEFNRFITQARIGNGKFLYEMNYNELAIIRRKLHSILNKRDKMGKQFDYSLN